MNANLQRRVQRYGWDRAADDYEPYWSVQLRPAQDQLLQMAELAPGDHVLDIACGTGLVTVPAARAVGSGGRVVATDLSQEMVTRTAHAALRAGLAVETRRMDAETLDLPDRSFHVALSSLGLMYVPDPDRALAEQRRVLRPGGRAVAAVWGARNRCGWAEIFPIVDARVSSEVCPLFFQLGGPRVLEDAFRNAGFVDVTAVRIQVELRYRSADDAVGAAFAGGPVVLAHERFDARTRAEAYAEYLDSIASHRQDDGSYRVPGEFVIARGTSPV